jgi:hypothetical protein
VAGTAEVRWLVISDRSAASKSYASSIPRRNDPLNSGRASPLQLQAFFNWIATDFLLDL